MDGDKRQQEQPKGERMFSQQQYDMLLRCSKKKDISEWNQWRESHPEEAVLLQGASLPGTHLKGAVLQGPAWERGKIVTVQLREANLIGANLEGAKLPFACLASAFLVGANMKGTLLQQANLEDALMNQADLSGANLTCACLRGVKLVDANLERARLCEADMAGAYLRGASLRCALLRGANLSGAELVGANARGLSCRMAVADGSTLLKGCSVDHRTDFRGVGLGSVRVEPALEQLLEYNSRRMNWRDWYKEHRVLRWLVRPFWWMSDYGRSTGRIIAVFFGLAILFAAIYWIWGLVAPPGIVDKLFSDENGPLPAYHVPFRAIYFSIVTMTTLGFGDMYAARSIPGYVFLTIQVLLGYVLLAALVTRFAILFTAGGPAGKFSKPEKKPSRQERGERGG